MADKLDGKEGDPGSPQDAVDMHAELVAAGKGTEAAEMAAAMKTRFKDDFGVQMYLGEYYEQEGHTDQADACFARALELDPANNDAKYAVAVGAFEKGDLQYARKLLSYMETKGPHQEYPILYRLASAFLEKRDYGNAYELFRVLCRDFPHYARKDKNLRRDVKAVETALGVTVSILPKSPLKRQLTIAAAIVVLLVVGIFSVDYYFRTHRTLYLVNHFPVQAQVSIPGMKPIIVQSYVVRSTTIAAGKHTVSIKVGNRFSETVDIDIGYDFIERLTGDKDVFILNVGGSAVLVWEKTVYSTRPDPTTPYNYRFSPPTKFLTFKEIDYAFKEFPEEIQISDMKNPRVTKTRVDVVKGFPADIFDILVKNNTSPALIGDYAEAHLEIAPNNESLVEKYGDLCLENQWYDRGTAFLNKHLSVPSLPIEWHINYQYLSQISGNENELLSRYDEKLKAAPEDSDSLLLRGRVEPDRFEKLKYYERSLKANPENAYAWQAKGSYFAALGRLTDAKEAFSKACRLKPDKNQWSMFLFSIRLTLKEYDALEKETAEKLKKAPLEFSSFADMLQIYVIRGNIDKARKFKNKYVEDITKTLEKYPSLKKEVRDGIEITLAYFLRDLPQYINMAKSIANKQMQKDALFQGYIELLDMKEAEKLRPRYKSVAPPGYPDLLLWLGWKVMLNNDAKAGPWLEKAVSKLQNADSDCKTVASLLTGQEKDVIQRIDNLIISPNNKAIICTVLAALYYDNPQRRSALLKRAEQMNLSYYFPHHFLSTVINKLKK